MLGLEDLFGQVAGSFAISLHFVKTYLIVYIENLLQLFFGANHEAHAFPYLVGEVVEILYSDGVVNESKISQSEQEKLRRGFCH